MYFQASSHAIKAQVFELSEHVTQSVVVLEWPASGVSLSIRGNAAPDDSAHR